MAADTSKRSEPDEVTATPPVWRADPRFRIAVEALLDGLAIYSSIRDERGEIVDFRCEYANQAVTTNGGPPPDEQVGRTMRETFPKIAESGLFASHVRVVETGEPAVIEVPWYEDAGATGAFQVHTARLDDGCVVVFRDVTGRDDDELLRAAMDAGCAGFISKDRATHDLVAAVRTVSDGNAALPPATVKRLTASAPEPAQVPYGLTGRELEVLGLLAEGVTTRAIAAGLFISLNTARNHVQRTIRKLGAHSRLEAVAIAARAGLVRTERR